jgi:5,10-methylenetetrahydromethanopterin reductase
MRLRIGLLIAGTRPVREVISVARAAEEAGVEEIWVSEDYFENGAFVLAAAVAGATSDPRIGVGVINPWTRHPMLTAMEFATLVELTDGRAILGLGASNRGWMQDRCGIEFHAPVAVLSEATEVIRRALGGEHVTFGGRYFTVDAALARPPTGLTPIYFGVKGARMLDAAAALADGVVLSIMSSPGYITWVRDRVGPHVDMCAYVLAMPGPRARASIRPWVASYLGIHGAHDITARGGLTAEAAIGFQQARVRGRSAADDVTEDMIDSFAVAGDLDACVAALDRLAAAGLDSAVLKDPGDASVDDLLQLVSAYRHHHTPIGL